MLFIKNDDEFYDSSQNPIIHKQINGNVIVPLKKMMRWIITFFNPAQSHFPQNIPFKMKNNVIYK